MPSVQGNDHVGSHAACLSFLSFRRLGLGCRSTAALPAAGSKAEEFAKINKEWTDLIANLGALKIEYATSTRRRQEGGDPQAVQ